MPGRTADNRDAVRLALMVVVVFAAAVWKFVLGEHSNACDLSVTSNVDFAHYYGVTVNHFSVVDAAAFHKLDINDLPPFQEVPVMTASPTQTSVIAYACRGSGKSFVLHEYRSKQFKKHFVVQLFKAKVNGYITTLEATSHATPYEPLWGTSDMTDAVLAELVDQFISTYHGTFAAMRKRYASVVLEKRLGLVAIACMYYNGPNLSLLEEFVSAMIDYKCRGWIWNSDCSIESDNVVTQAYNIRTRTYEHIAEFRSMVDDARSIRVLPSSATDNNRLRALRLFFGALLQFNVPYSTFSLANPNNKSWKLLAKFVDDMIFGVYGQNTAVIIDELDQNPSFQESGGSEINTARLQEFVNSISELQQLALDQQAHFDVALFFPVVCGLDYSRLIIRQAKLNGGEIIWSLNDLMRYADLMLDDMRRRASASKCRTLPKFTELTGYDTPGSPAKDVLKCLRTPRHINVFVTKLLLVLRSAAVGSQHSFIAQGNDTVIALQRAWSQMTSDKCDCGDTDEHCARLLQPNYSEQSTVSTSTPSLYG